MKFSPSPSFINCYSHRYYILSLPLCFRYCRTLVILQAHCYQLSFMKESIVAVVAVIAVVNTIAIIVVTAVVAAILNVDV